MHVVQNANGTKLGKVEMLPHFPSPPENSCTNFLSLTRVFFNHNFPYLSLQFSPLYMGMAIPALQVIINDKR